MKTLQQQYNLIKEGQGDKNFFMRQALRQFPEYINVNNTFEQTVSILKGKSIISEGVGGVVTNNGRKDWFKIFEAEVKAMAKETDKEVMDAETAGFDYKDEKDMDNVYGQAFLMGYVAEMCDPKNSEKTVMQVKEIVAKNLAKDPNHYVKTAMFGMKGIEGQQLDTPKEVKGKHKSSGYGDL